MEAESDSIPAFSHSLQFSAPGYLDLPDTGGGPAIDEMLTCNPALAAVAVLAGEV